MDDSPPSATGPVTLAIRVKEHRHRLPSVTILVLQVAATAAVFALMLHVLANVVMRYAFASPLSGVTEWVQYVYMPIQVFIGFVLAKHAKQMIEAPVLFERLTWGNRRILTVFNSALVVVVCLLASYYSLTELAMHGFEIKQTGGVMGLQIWPVFFILPAVFLGLAAMYAWDGLQAVRGHFRDTGMEEAYEQAADGEA